MTLQRQTISIPIGIGRDDANAPAFDEDGNADARNVRFTKRGVASKRRPQIDPAYTGVPLSANAVIDGRGVPTIISREGARRLDEALSKWVAQNVCDPRTSSVKIDPLIRGRIQAFNPSIAILQDVLCVVWTDTETYFPAPGKSVPVGSADLMVAFFRVADGELSLLSGPSLVDKYARSAHVVALETGDANRCFVLIGEEDDTKMQWSRYVLSAGTYSFGSSPTSFGGFRDVSNRGFDVCASRGGTPRAFGVWEASGGLGARIVSVAATGSPTVLTIAGHPSGGIFHDASNGLIATIDAFGRVGLTADTLSGGTTSIPLTHTLSVTNADRYVIGQLTSSTYFAAWSDYRINETAGSIAAPKFWGTEIVTLGIHFSEVATRLLPNVGILGKPAYVSSLGTSLLPLHGYASARGFIVSIVTDANGTINPAVHAAFSSQLEQRGNRVDLAQGPAWSAPVVTDSSGALHVVYPVALAVNADGEIAQMQLDLARANVVNHAPERMVRANDLALFAGGHGLACVDGQIVSEITPQRADPPLLTDKSTAYNYPNPGALTDKLYVSVGWGWIDATGRDHRGPISEQQGIVWNSFFTGGGTVTAKLWAAPIPFPTSLLGERLRTLYLDVYCSKLNDASQVRRLSRIYKPPTDSQFPDCCVFYFGQTGGTADPAYPNGYVTLTNDVTTALSSSLPTPYTDDELAPEAPAALLDVVSTQSRLWALSAESRFSVLVTKPIVAGYAPEFAPELSVDVPQEGGECIGLAALDDKVIVFKESRIYVIQGDPGDANGARSTIQKPRLVSGDVGAVCAASIVEGPFGVVFQSRRGIELLTRGLELRFIGERVLDAFTTAQRLSGTLVPADTQVRWNIVDDPFATPWIQTGEAIAWDYLRDEWSAWDSLSSTSTAVIGEDVWTVAPNGTPAQELETWGSALFNTSITTRWLKVNGAQGFQRLWRVIAILTYYNGDVSISLAYDYDDNDVDTATWTEADLTGLAAASNGRLQLSVRPSRQKCESFRVTIATNCLEGQTPPYPTVGRGADFIGLDAEIGVKSGTFRRALATSNKR